MRHPRRHRRPIARWVQMAALGTTICNALSGWVEAHCRYPSPMGLDDRRQATGRDSSECPKTVTYHTGKGDLAAKAETVLCSDKQALCVLKCSNASE